jgi:hypothetical protein
MEIKEPAVTYRNNLIYIDAYLDNVAGHWELEEY